MYDPENNNNGEYKGPRKKGNPIVNFVIDNSRLIIGIIVCAALIAFIEPAKTFVYTLTNFDKVVEARGDVILEQHIFIRDRFTLEAPEKWDSEIKGSIGTLSENQRNGADIYLYQKYLKFEDGNLYRHIRTPYVSKLKVQENDNFKMLIPFPVKKVKGYYYDTEAGGWTELKNIHGGTSLPRDTVTYLNFNNEIYTLISPPFAYNTMDKGVVSANDDRTFTAHFEGYSDGWSVLTNFANKKDMLTEVWIYESSEPILTVEDGNVIGAAADAIAEVFSSGENRLLYDGYYKMAGDDITPISDYTLVRTIDTASLEKLMACDTLSDLAYAQLYISAQSINEQGYYTNDAQSSELYASYGIKHNYFDAEKNVEIGELLIKAYEKYDEDFFKDCALKLADYCKGFAEENAETTAAGKTVLPEYCNKSGSPENSPASESCYKAVMSFIEAADALR